MKRNGNKSTALSPEALACYLPLNRGRAKTGYEQEVIQRLMDICRLFRAGSRKYEHDKVFCPSTGKSGCGLVAVGVVQCGNLPLPLCTAENRDRRRTLY